MKNPFIDLKPKDGEISEGEDEEEEEEGDEDGGCNAPTTVMEAKSLARKLEAAGFEIGGHAKRRKAPNLLVTIESLDDESAKVCIASDNGTEAIEIVKFMKEYKAADVVDDITIDWVSMSPSVSTGWYCDKIKGDLSHALHLVWDHHAESQHVRITKKRRVR